MFGPTNTAERLVYDTVRAQILRGVLTGGTPIRQQEIANELGVSRIPVRDALRHLAAEGLISMKSNRRVVVSSISPGYVREVFQIRAVLEGLAARMAALNLSPGILDRLAMLCEQMDIVSAQPDCWVPVHDEFHDVICVAAKMPRLHQEIAQLRVTVEPYLRVIISGYGLAAMSGHKHRLVLAALRERDQERAERVMRKHVTDGLEEIRPAFERPEQNTVFAVPELEASLER